MGRRLDLTGKRFGRLVAIEDVSIPGELKKWRCKCDCGNHIIVLTANLRNTNTKSCGCLAMDLLMKRNYKHGYTFKDRSKNHPLYAVFNMMIVRCYKRSDQRYYDYGGRGIRICSKWLNSISNFIKWGIDNGWEKGLQIDRIDNDGDYTPENCRFVTPMVNNQNKRTYKTSKTGYSGIVYDKRSKKFRSSLSYCKKYYYFGTFETAVEACAARNSFIIENNFKTRIQTNKELHG